MIAMNLVLCSTDNGLLKRWKSILESDFQLHQVAATQQLQALLQQNEILFLLIHRPFLELKEMREMVFGEQQKVIIASDQPNEDEGLWCLRRGAAGYLNTYSSPQRLREAVQAVQAGHVWVGHSLMQRLIQTAASHDDEEIDAFEKGQQYGLTTRELEIAKLITAGSSNLEIAADLNIAESTVKAHLGAIFKKTETEGRLQLALLFRT